MNALTGPLMRSLMLCCLVATPAGCASTSGTTSLDGALRSYRSGRYAEAHQAAAGIARDTTAQDRHAAAYVAGLSAYQLGRLHEAEHQFRTARAATDEQTAGRATVMLGMISTSHERPSQAAEFFIEAYPKLSGGEARQAASRAASACAESGDETRATHWQSIAARTAEGGVPVVAIPEARPTGQFTLQVGAFRERSRAASAARSAEDQARAAGLGTVRILGPEQVGGSMYLVQLGRFSTRSEAAAVRAQLGRLEYIVVPRVAIR